jgi:hypothetical protein
LTVFLAAFFLATLRVLLKKLVSLAEETPDKRLPRRTPHSAPHG